MFEKLSIFEPQIEKHYAYKKNMYFDFRLHLTEKIRPYFISNDNITPLILDRTPNLRFSKLSNT